MLSLRVVVWFVGGVLVLVGGAAVKAAESFGDGGGVHESAVAVLAGRGILAGTECGDGRICPDGPFLRWVMGVWVTRALDESPSTSLTGFTDVDPDEWWAPYVERLAELDISRGCATSPARYCPDRPVTRGQMATFLAKAFDLEPGSSAGFADTAGNRHAAGIDALAAAGITTGCAASPVRYCPDRPVTRGQMATFLARALDLVPRIKPGTSTTTGFTSVTAGYYHSCGIRTDGTVVCWGNNEDGQLDTPGWEVYVCCVRLLSFVWDSYRRYCGLLGQCLWEGTGWNLHDCCVRLAAFVWDSYRRFLWFAGATTTPGEFGRAGWNLHGCCDWRESFVWDSY